MNQITEMTNKTKQKTPNSRLLKSREDQIKLKGWLIKAPKVFAAFADMEIQMV